MSVDLTLSGHEPEPRSMRLCKNASFDLFTTWAGTLPPGAYPAVDAFTRDMRYTPTDVLEDQLNSAALDHPPPCDGTHEIVGLLLDRLGLGYPDETLEISFG